MKKLYSILALVITLITFAQAPQGFNYQATVRNSTGALIVNQNVNFKFNIMLNSATSLPVFSETHMVPTDDVGQINLVIGTGTATTGNFSTINWGTGNYYLGIELNTGAGYVAMGTTQLLSVPYALYANSSGNAQNTIPNLASVLAVNNGANNLQIKNLADPNDAQDAITKSYLEAQLALLQLQINNLQNIFVTPSVSQQSICSAGQTNIILTSNQTGATFTWTAHPITPNSDNAIVGFTSGNGSTIVQTLNSISSSPVVVRYIITPYVGSLSGQQINVDVTVNPKPVISNIVNIINSGDTFNINLTTGGGVNNSDIIPNGTNYTWVNNNTAIGLAASGTGLPIFTPINTGTTPIVAQITVIPTAGSCQGESFTITVTVNSPTTPLQNVTINSQVWHVANLNVSTYTDGTVIPQVSDPSLWGNLTTGAWCYYNNDPTTGATYGKIYNWYAVAGIHDNDPNTPNKSLAPTGWHVPSDTEWNALINFLDPNANGGLTVPNVAGSAMKEIGTTHWFSPNTGATNSSGFTGLPGGYRFVDGSYAGLGGNGYWWSSSENGVGGAWYRNLNAGTTNVTKIGQGKELGYSVRCIRD